MSRYVAFLRGINVGGHRVKMQRLRTLFEEVGCERVETFIASGNVVFSTELEDLDDLRTRIEAHLADGLGYDVPTFIRSRREVEAIAGHRHSESRPEEDSGSSVYVIFLPGTAKADLRSRLDALGSEMDAFDVVGREIYWHIRGKLTESPLFGSGLIDATGDLATTTRNMTTMRRLVAKLDAGP